MLTVVHFKWRVHECYVTLITVKSSGMIFHKAFDMQVVGKM